jgi:serine/threonine-protein kinase
VVDVVDVLRAPDGRPCIVAGLLDGEDLQHRLEREGRIPVVQALQFARQMCRGLADAHALGIVHRDLKPSNVLLAKGPDGRTTVKLLDFGVAKLADGPELTRTGAVVGTPSYMPPEQARGEQTVDARADVYAVGAVLYHMVLGQPPYPAGEAMATLARLVQQEPPQPRRIDRRVPASVEAVIQHAMARDPAARIGSALELEEHLAAVAAEQCGSEADAPPVHSQPLDGSHAAQQTLMLPQGTVRRATDLARRARVARPAAALLTSGLAIAAGLVAAVMLSTVARAVASGAPTLAERVLVGLGSVGACAAAATLLLRAVRRRWASAVAVQAWVHPWWSAALASTSALGSIALLLYGTAALGLRDAGPGPLATAMALLGSILVGAVAGWRSRRHEP